MNHNGEEYPILKKGYFLCSPKNKKYSPLHHQSPSQVIASNYCPSMKNLNLHTIPKRRQLKVKKSKKTEPKPEFKADGLPPGLCYLKDLLNRPPLVKKKIKRYRAFPMPLKKVTSPPRPRSAPLPVWPEDQLHQQRAIVQALVDHTVSKKDAQRITYYLTEGIDSKCIDKYPTKLLKNATRKIGKIYTKNKRLQPLLESEKEEVLSDYELSARKSLLDYILQDPDECKRLGIKSHAQPFPRFTISAPVPWHTSYLIGRQFCRHNLFSTHIIMRKLHHIWEQKFSNLLFVPTNRLDEKISYPLTAQQLEQQVDKLCAEAKKVLLKNWLPSCADVIMDLRDQWQDLGPTRRGESLARVERFFACVGSLMSRHLRLLVFRSLRHLLKFFEKYKDGNDFGTEFVDFKLVKRPLVTIKLTPQMGTSEILFTPSLEELKDLIHRCFIKIIDVNHDVPRLEAIMFPDMKESGLYLSPVGYNEEQVNKILDQAMSYFNTNLVGPQTYLHVYDKFLHILTGEEEKYLQAYVATTPLPSLKDFSKHIENYEAMKLEIGFLRKNVPLNFLSLDCSEINDVLWQAVDMLRNYIVEHHITLSHAHNRQICNEFDIMSNRASELPEDTASLVELTKYLTHCQEIKMFELRKMIRTSANNLMFLVSHAIFPGEDIQLNARVFLWPRDMESVFEISQNRLSHRREIVEGVLRDKKNKFEQSLALHERQLQEIQRKDPPMLTMDEMKDSVAAVRALSDILQHDKHEAEAINEEESLLNWLPTPFTELYNMLVSIEPFDKLWNTVLNFHVSYEKWFYGPFLGLDAAAVQTQVLQMLEVLVLVSKQLVKVPGSRRVADLVKGKLEQFRALLPLLHCLCNPGLCERHWQQMSSIVGFELDPKEQSTLAQMVELGLVNFISQFEEISTCASKEFALEQKLKNMMAEWEHVKFECIPYRESGVCTLAAVDEIQLMLDDHILKAQTMHSSPYVKAFETEMQKWEDKLISMQDILDTWLTCQATWLYLEPIFSSEDIMRQMPREGQKFVSVDTSWRDIMKNTARDPHVLAATDMPDMLKTLRQCNTLLEEIQKGLNEYLEKKRLFFPRFFFLSNDELLEILSETKDPQRVQPQLKKCFEGISKLDFNSDLEIVGIISSEDEVVPLSGKIVPADAKGMVEKWLAQVEELMIRSVRDMCREAVAAYQRQPRAKWALQWPGQAVACASSIHWTTEVSTAIRSNEVASYLDKCNTQLQDIVEILRAELPTKTRNTLATLILADSHARDVVQQLLTENVTNLQDFTWLGQMRNYWREDSVIVSMVSTDIAYGFEYLGNTPRLVITPLTDRCYRSIMVALKMNLGAALEGPSASGKTETCKDLAKAAAKQCIVFNCSEGLDYKAMAKFFKGLAQAGAWACFDEFDLIRPEVLSVVAQQIFIIQNAIRKQLEKFNFEGTEITLDPTCAIFVSLNKSQNGNKKLPENLKALFRPVALTQPDYFMTTEVFLFSAGFLHSQKLARKVATIYQLCSDLLSKQPHYDFSMRAVKTVLCSSYKLKLQQGFLTEATFESEASLIIKAVYDTNAPKFTANDLVLFKNIIHELLPGCESLRVQRSELETALIKEMTSRGLQATPWYLSKVLQLYEALQSQHGVMLVGDPFAGKTSAYQVLASVLTEIAGNPETNMVENKVICKVINPKAITSGQLFGCFDPISHEWSDGILANTFREYAASTTSDRKWIMFDGPVDASWVENMNTALDDNKKLCLMSGEIIKMSESMCLLFECETLQHATPATVSRCAIIYMDALELGWHTLHETFVCGPLRDRLAMDEQFELIRELLSWLLTPVLELVSRLPRFIRTSHMHLFSCFSKLFLCLLGTDTQFPSLWLQGTLLFSIIWGLGSTLTGDGRKEFDSYLRVLLLGENKQHPRPKVFKLTPQQLIPDKGLVFDWVHDKKNNGMWLPWTDVLDKSQPQALVATAELACQQFFLRTCLAQGNPLLFVGPSGTGKSAITNDFLSALPKDKFLPNIVNFSAATSANQTQEMIMSRLDRRRKGVFGPPMGKQCALFVDDVGLPRQETLGAQPAVELLRQWIDHGHWYDKDTTRLELVDILFVAAMGAGCCLQVTPRFIRHMHVVAIDSISDTTLEKIFTTVLIDNHFSKGFNSNVTRMAKAVVQACLSVHRFVVTTFLPTPERPHLFFCNRELTRLAQGLTCIPASHLTDPDKLLRLWVHEAYRVYYDRLSDDSSRIEFFGIIKQSFGKYFNKSMDSVLRRLLPEGEKMLDDSYLQGLFFGNFMEPDANPRIYDEISDPNVLSAKMQFYLDEHNSHNRTPLALVMFQYAVQHICRVCRVLQLPNSGHAILVGVAGSGRRSVAKMAATMAGHTLFQIVITKTYNFSDWRNDLNRLLKRAGAENKATVFLISDTQLKDVLFLEDLNLILCSGDIPNLFTTEEKTEILEKMQTVAKEMGKKIEASPLALYNYFLERVRANLHVILTMSPVGRTFCERLRMFPSLVSCCLIDWFTMWPERGLEKVADHFLQGMDLDDDIRGKCIALCKHFHMSAAIMCNRFKKEVGRFNYNTPASYLELIHTFQKLYSAKTEAIKAYKNRYIMGLQKLDFAATQVGEMQIQLNTLRPQLIETSEETDKLMIKIEQDTVEVEAKKEIVGSDESKANEAAAAAQAIKDDCEGDLAEAIPALESAVNALNTLKPADITVVKAMKNPPPGVKLVMEAIAVMKGVKPDRKPDPTGSGKMLEDFWGPSLKLLGDIKFLDSLKSYNKDNISPNIMKRIRDKYIHDREFHPESVRKSSMACEGLCKWVRAIEVYDRVIKIVAPKKAKLAEAEAELAIQMGTLNEKRAQLQEVTDKLQTLNDDFAAMTKKKKDLEDNIDLCSQKLERAEKLIGGLGGEKHRWGDMAKQLDNKLANVTGDILLASAVVTYLGAFNSEYREESIIGWTKQCQELELPCTFPFSLAVSLGDAMQMRNWTIAGLPGEPFSLDSGIIVKNCRRWPLMIDPQGQASKWIKNLEAKNGLIVTKLTNRDYTLALEKAIKQGKPLLIENMGEEIDPILEPILLKKTYMDNGVEKIKFGDFVSEYSHNFCLYMTTTLSNPHYLPESTVKVTLLNFVLRPPGLEEQLLAQVVSHEQSHLEDSKGELLLEGARSRQQLQDIEDKILEVLSSSEGNILEDETGIEILSTSKALSEEISSKQEISSQKEAEIDKARNQYLPVARYASVLFFCIAELSALQPTYQYSLSWFTNLYLQAIKNSEKNENINQRIKNLNKHITKSIYENICRSLFEKDKIVFSFLLWIGILRSEGTFDEDTWKFILQATPDTKCSFPENPDSSWLTDYAWTDAVEATKLPKMTNLLDNIGSNMDEWKEFCLSGKPHLMKLPSPYEDLRGLDKIAILKCFRPECLLPAINDLIHTELGSSYTDPPTFDLQESFNTSSPCIPLILVLSAGKDPTEMLFRFAKERGVNTVQAVSLGQEQGARAEAAILDGVCNGGWVILHNCHLASSWMPELERICDNVMTPDKTHSGFRLWLTTCPAKSLPVSILEKGVKMTTETPKGLKSKIKHCFQSLPLSDKDFFEKSTKPYELFNLSFSLSFFHAVLKGRMMFSSLGWNTQYEFNDIDFKICIVQLQEFIEEYKDVPYGGLQYMIAECFYGGRISDPCDRKLLASLLKLYCCQAVVEDENYTLGRIIKMPDISELESCISSLSNEATPDIYELNQNASFSKGLEDTTRILSSVMLVQPYTSISQPDIESTVQDIVHDILVKIPLPFDMSRVKMLRPIRQEDCFTTILHQEVARLNILLSTVLLSLKQLTKALQGHSAMTSHLQEMYNTLENYKVPSVWAEKSYPSLKPLHNYIQHLIRRAKFFETWISQGIPEIFWISGFFSPQTLFTGLLQNYSKQSKIPLEELTLTYEVTEFYDVQSAQENLTKKTANEILIHGLYLEGAHWNRTTGQLMEPHSGVLHDKLPIIRVQPFKITDSGGLTVYTCPVYTTSQRGESQLVTFVSLNTDQPASVWINQGVACLCQLKD